MKRNFRSAKFAEYLSTYAILNGMHLHPTVLIEKRDAGRGYGVFVRDACDAGTSLIVLPRTSLMTQGSLLEQGTGISCRPLLEHLWSNSTTSVSTPFMDCMLHHHASQWVVLAWQLALELTARHSRWWGWLSSVPSYDDILQTEHAAQLASRAGHPQLAASMAIIREAVQREISDGYDFIRLHATLVPPKPIFLWAARLLLTRAILTPSGDGASVELALAPIVDLCNMDILHGAAGDDEVVSGNADIEFLGTDEALPDWCLLDVASGTSGSTPTHSSADYEGGVMLCLNQPLVAGQEVLLADAALWWQGADLTSILERQPLLNRFVSDLPHILRMERFAVALESTRSQHKRSH